ncbi:MAG: hydrogenase [Firmicutes bacterium]|nr:hydrogenase [Bacillota bacterium]
MQSSVDVLSAALIVSTSWLIAVRYIASAVKWLSFQSLMLALMTSAIAYETHRVELYWIALLTLVIKAWIIPMILYRVLKRVGINRQAQIVASRDKLILGVLIMWIIGYYVIPTGNVLGGSHIFLAVSIGMLLSGVLVMVTHQKALMQGMGLIVIENGLFLAALSTSLGMPLLVDIGIFIDVLVVVILIAFLTLRMDEEFSSMHIGKLRRLRG